MTQRRSPRRKTDWFDTIFSQDMANGSQNIQRLTPTGFSPGHTLTRMLISFSFVPNPLGVATGIQRLDFGIGIASEDAFVAGAVPDANAPLEFPPRGWVLRDEVIVNSRLDGANGQDSTPVIRLTYDIRAQRMLDNGVLYVATNNVAGGGTAFTVAHFGFVRILMLLP